MQDMKEGAGRDLTPRQFGATPGQRERPGARGAGYIPAKANSGKSRPSAVTGAPRGSQRGQGVRRKGKDWARINHQAAKDNARMRQQRVAETQGGMFYLVQSWNWQVMGGYRDFGKRIGSAEEEGG